MTEPSWDNRTNQTLSVRLKLTPFGRCKSMVLNKELYDGNIGYFWMCVVPMEWGSVLSDERG